MRSSTVASIVAVVVAGILAAGTAHADFIRPSGASASTTYGSGTAPARLIDLAGSIPESLSAESAAATHPQGSGAAGFGQWHSAINDINDGVWVRLDLGKRYDLSQIYIWQGNQTGESDRGVQDFTVEVSKDGSTWTPALGASVLTQSAGGNIPAQTYALSNADGVLHARISGSTNYGDSYTGLSEVRFEGTDQWITPNGVAASSFYGYNQHPDHTIDGSGLSAESRTGTHSTNSSQLWHSGVGYASGGGAPVVDDQWLVYALPGTFDLTDVHFWNMNQSGFTNRSIQDYDLQVSSDGVNWATPLLNDTLNQAGGGAEAVQTRTLSASNVRFVRIDIDTDYSGVANNYVGLSEIRFEGAQVAPGPQIANQFAATGGGLGKPVSSTDLLQGIVATSSLALNPAAGPLSQLTDGLGSGDFAHRVIATDQANNWVLTYDLGLGAGMLALLDEINVYSYNTDERRYVDFDVEISGNHQGTWEYLFIGANNFPLGAGNVTLTSLFDISSAQFPIHATDLRFTFRPVNASTWSTSLVEIDVLGELVPEPATMTLLAFGGLGALARRRRRSRSTV